MSFKIHKTLLYVGSILASVVMLPFSSYAACPTTDVSSSVSIRSISSTYKIIDNNSADCEYIIIKRSSSKKNTDSLVLEEEQEYFYDHDCDYEDSPFGVSGLIITNNLTRSLNNSNFLGKSLLNSSISLFNVYSFGGSCVFSIYDF